MARATVFSFILLFVTLLAFSNADETGDRIFCMTNFGENYDCVSIYQCPFAHEIASKDKGQITQEETDLLRKHFCGWNGADPKVCCEDA